MGWKYIGVSVNDSFIIGEIDIFKEDWKSTDNIAICFTSSAFIWSF